MTEAEDELAQYFEVCGYRPDDVISIVTRAAADGPLFWGFYPVSEAPRQIAARSRINCWFSANPMSPPQDKESRGSTEDVVAVRALWADLDIKPGGMPDKRSAGAVVDTLSEMLGARPVAIVWSGHGYQPRWKLDPDGMDLHTPARFAPVIERFGRLVQEVAKRHGGKADSIFDMPRIIRAPHTTNIKPGLDPAPTKVWNYSHGQHVSFERLIEVLDENLPADDAPSRPAADTENRHVGFERGNAYVRAALDAIRTELADIADWPAGRTDERGRGWEKIQADAALRMASLAKADWNSLDLDEAKNFFVVWCPKDEHWTVRKVTGKWSSQVRRAEPATAPADITDDPLAGGARPLSSAPARPAGATEGHDSSTGAPRGELGDEPPVDDGSAELAERPLSWEKYTWDDFGNADRTIAMYGHILRYSPAMKRWLRYEDGAWRESETGGERCVQDMLRQLFRLEGPLYSDIEIREGRKVSSERGDFADWWQKQRAASKVRAAATVIRNDNKLDVAPAVFDSEPMLLNCPNGIVDLATGELLEHDPALMLRRQIPVTYDPEAKAPRWEAFLERVQPSIDMRDYIERIIGYSITGRTSEQVVFFHMGPPASGKSVFLRVLEAVLGDFSRVVPPTTLLNKKGPEQHPTDVMGMEGRRMLQVSETAEGARLDEALLKRLSGEETITARGMGENFRDFRMVGKVHLVSNHRPHISDDPAVHRRLHLVEWNVSIPPEERDPFLAETIIREELEGVLAWAVRGTKRWLESRLAKPVEAHMATSSYFSEEDEFGQFMEDELIIGADAFVESKIVYRRYRQWCEGQGMKPMSMVAFGRKLSSRGVEAARTTQARGFKVALQAPKWVQDPLG